MRHLEKTLGNLIHTGYVKTRRGRRKIPVISKVLKNLQQRHKEKSRELLHNNSCSPWQRILEMFLTEDA